MANDNTLRRAARTTVLLLLTLFFIFPVLWTLSISIRPANSVFAQPPEFIFSPITKHLETVFNNSEVAHGLTNSLLVAGLSTILVVVLGTPAAYALARLRVRGRDDIMMFVLASRMAPPVAMIIPFFLIYKEVGLLETQLGLIIAYLTFNLSFYVWVLGIFIKEIPADLESAGHVDGYGPWRVFTRVVLPLMRPSVIATAILVFIFAWNEFAFALILGGREAETLPIVISRAITPSGVNFGELAAMGVIGLAPILLIVFLLHKHIIRGLSMGAVKG
ncbi:MAG: multiple sugar transport system permease protein [Thermoleophilaceae bacterium]|nr:multiple sugar transport system permease protein [Thermoleophilaceae bacterium]